METKGKINVKTIIYILILVIIILFGRYIYCKYNYYDYIKGVREVEKPSFTRDSNIVYSNMDSYKVENRDFKRCHVLQRNICFTKYCV